MTTKSIQDFIRKMKSDNLFHDRILAIEDVDERLAVIKSEGFEFTEEELSEFRQTVMQSTKNATMDEWTCCIAVPYYYR